MKKKLEDYIKGLLELNEKYKRVYRIEEETEWYSPYWLEHTCNEILAIIESGDDKE